MPSLVAALRVRAAVRRPHVLVLELGLLCGVRAERVACRGVVLVRLRVGLALALVHLRVAPAHLRVAVVHLRVDLVRVRVGGDLDRLVHAARRGHVDVDGRRLALDDGRGALRKREVDVELNGLLFWHGGVRVLGLRGHEHVVA